MIKKAMDKSRSGSRDLKSCSLRSHPIIIFRLETEMPSIAKRAVAKMTEANFTLVDLAIVVLGSSCLGHSSWCDDECKRLQRMIPGLHLPSLPLMNEAPVLFAAAILIMPGRSVSPLR